MFKKTKKLTSIIISLIEKNRQKWKFQWISNADDANASIAGDANAGDSNAAGLVP